MVSFSKWHYQIQNSIIKLNKGNDNVKESQSFSLRTTYGKEFFSIGVSISYIQVQYMYNKELKNEKRRDEEHTLGWLLE